MSQISQEIINEVNKVMMDGFEIPEEKLKPEATLMEHLELDSLDAVDMVVHLEEKLDIKVDGEQLKHIRTLGDVYQLVDNLNRTKSVAPPPRVNP